MVADWKVEPVGLDSVVWSTHHHTNVVGVVVARVKVSVISDHHRHVHFDLAGIEQGASLYILIKRAFLTENLLEGFTQLNPKLLTSSSEAIERLLAEVVVLGRRKEGSIEKSLVLEHAQIDDVVANSGAAGLLVSLWVHKDTEGNILQREMAGSVDRKP